MADRAALLEALAGWIQTQRWFAGKGTRPRLRILGTLRWHDDDELRVRTCLVADESREPAVVYQVPLTWHRSRPVDLEGALIALVPDDHDRTWNVYDGAHDPAFTLPLLRAITGGASVRGDATGPPWVSAHGESAAPMEGHGGGMLPGAASSHVLRGEQSNTSIIYDADGGDGTICKLFRTLHHGENPDVVLQSALFAAGSPYVPATVGSLAGQWPDPQRADGRAAGHLAFAQQFLQGAEDAWRRALRAAADREDFRASAREMGVALAEVHEALAAVLPTRDATGADVDDAVRGWTERLDAAVSHVPSVEGLREPILALYRQARNERWPRMQRIHGDLHLGQILATSDGGWAIIDFEGEPMRPLADRSDVDLPLRDIAGMLRSFDYVAGTQRETPGVREWAHGCREALLDGYTSRSGGDLSRHRALLDAFELDKALYEAVYEARNRPTWIGIPVEAIRRLALRDAG